PLPLGGKLIALDPNALPGDRHTLTLSVPVGALTADPAALPPTVTLTVVDSRTVTLDGPLPDINAFLGAPGSLTFDPQDAAFSGAVPLGYTLTIHPAEPPNAVGPPPATGAVVLALAPEASALTPLAPDAATDAGVPVGLDISVPGLADLGSTETATIQLLGLPPGALLNHGTTSGGGAWNLTPADLVGLVFTPPPGFAGVIPLTVLVTVTDSNPELASSSTAVGTKAFAVTVRAPDGTVPPPGGGGGGPLPPPSPGSVPATRGPGPGSPAGNGSVGTTTTNQLPPPPGGNGPADIGPGGPTGGGSRADAADHGHEGEGGPVGEGGPPNPGERPRQEAVATVGVVYGGPGHAGHAERGPRPDGGAPPAAGSLFSRAEPPPAPLAAAADRHPLPPVLPLDQSAPAAGFTDSGGDSLALIDALYRDAAALIVVESVTVPVVHTPPRETRPEDVAAGATATGPDGPAAPAAADGPAPAGGGWTFHWLVVGVGLAATGWFAHRRGAARRCRRFLARLFPSTRDLA
ncbi:hypothetical protein J0H58_17415, partial [bacterium]|nr:hypothetical protein [bacterium]